MTNLYDLTQPGKYFYLEYPEFLEFLCRVAILYYYEKTNMQFLDVETKIENVMEILWEQKPKPKQQAVEVKTAAGKRRDKGQK